MGIDAIDIVMGLEEEFGIEISSEAREFQTVGDLSAWISKQVPSQPATAVWPTVQRIVAEKLNMPTARVQPESHWVEDLLID